MKKTFAFVLIFFFFQLLFSQSQGTLNYQLTVIDLKGNPESNLEIVFVDATTFEITRLRTDSEGRIEVLLDKGETWVLHIGEMKAHTVLKLFANMNGTAEETVTYDLEYWRNSHIRPKNREGLKIDHISSLAKINEIGNGQDAIVEVKLKNPRLEAWPNMPVSLFCYQNLTIYEGYTDINGSVRFKVPNGLKYQVDVDGEKDFHPLILNRKHSSTMLNLTFEKINFSEKLNPQGFVIQSFYEPIRPVSNRVMVTLKVKGGPKGGEDEDIFIESAGSGKKYAGKTGLNGEITFLLPKGQLYQVNFHFQQNATTIDLTRYFGISDLTTHVYYDADPRLQFPERYLPNKKELKTYDINAFNQASLKNSGDNLISVSAKWGNQKINSTSKEAILELGFSINAEKLESIKRKPVNISFVLDRSGSMGGKKIDILRKAMVDFVSKLEPSDKVSVIFFESSPSLAYPHQTPKKKELEDIVYALQAFGGTNIYEGLKMGYQQLSHNYNVNSVNRVILLTDGFGSKPIDDVLEQSKKYFNKGISVSTIGIGAAYNQSLLSLLSKYSGGFEHQVMNSKDIQTALSNEYQSLFSPIASNLKVNIEYNNELIYKTLYGIPASKTGVNFVSFKLSEVFSTLNKMALIKFKLQKANKTLEKEKVVITVTYFDELNQREVKEKRLLALEWTEESDLELIADENLKTMYSVATINQCLKVIADYCDNKEYKLAHDEILATLRALRKTNKSNYRQDLIPLIKELEKYLKGLKRLI